jgi:hypothetical protein
MIASLSECNKKIKFFNSINEENFNELKEILLDEDIRPWKFIQNEGFTGKLF